MLFLMAFTWKHQPLTHIIMQKSHNYVTWCMRRTRNSVIPFGDTFSGVVLSRISFAYFFCSGGTCQLIIHSLRHLRHLMHAVECLIVNAPVWRRNVVFGTPASSHFWLVYMIPTARRWRNAFYWLKQYCITQWSGVGKSLVFGGIEDIVRGHFLRNSNVAYFGEVETHFHGNWFNFDAQVCECSSKIHEMSGICNFLEIVIRRLHNLCTNIYWKFLHESDIRMKQSGLLLCSYFPTLMVFSEKCTGSK